MPVPGGVAAIGFLRWPTGPRASATMSLPRDLNHDAELQRYHQLRDYEQLG